MAISHYYTQCGKDQVMTGSPPQTKLGVTEGRIIIVEKALLHILAQTGHHVKEIQLTEKNARKKS
jgi:hypothetical protein